MKAAGPTTSIREEPYQADVIKRYGVRAVIGKGGMGPKTLAALKEFGAVYLNAHRRRGAVLRADRAGGAGRAPDGVRHSGSHVASAGARLRGHRHHGRPRQQPARRVEKATAAELAALEAAVASLPLDDASVTIMPYGQVAQSVERSPEKAGVGGSIPSLATMFSAACRPSNRHFHSVSFQNYGAGRLASSESAAWIAGGWLSISALVFAEGLPATYSRGQVQPVKRFRLPFS